MDCQDILPTINSYSRSQSTILPMGRVKTIMKSSPDVDQISNESLFLITKVRNNFVEGKWCFAEVIILNI